MKARVLYSLITVTVFLTAVTAVRAQTAYSNTVMSLGPIGYWPMHEVEAPAPGDIETNYGTLGFLGTGYYPDWAAKQNFSAKRGIAGALANDPDQAVSFTRNGNPAAATYTNYLFIPHSSPLSTLNPPFSVECWFYPTNANSEDIWAQNGFEGLNAGSTGSGDAGVGGVRLVWENSTNTGFQIFGYYKNNSPLSIGFSGNVGGTSASPPFNWYHLVVTCDANTNFALYVNGTQATLSLNNTNGPGSYTPDYWTPLTIGGGRGGTRGVGGYVDEFAVYTNVLQSPDIAAHYNAGVSGGLGQYPADVLASNPVIYLRMDAPATYTMPNAGSWPVLNNYGQTNGVAVGNGVYTPGTAPGILSGPVNPNGLGFGGVSGQKVAPLSGVSSFADAGFAAAYNPIGLTPFSVTALFRGNPADGRNQTIVGHSDNSWNIILNTSGKIVAHFGTNTSAAVTSAGTYNDGNWHQVVDVYAPGSNPNVAGTNALFVDGLLDNASVAVTTNGLLPGSSLDLMIGNDPQYTNNPAGVGRSFAGQICDVAMFNYTLMPSQIQGLYSNCQVAPYITGQPATGRSVNGGAGTFIFFGVIANGSGSLGYQWYFNTSSNYSGATPLIDGAKYSGSQTLQVTVTNLAPADGGFYYAVITNNYGSVTTRLATLTVFAAPTINNQYPVSYTNLFTVYAGASPTYSISASGAQPISYFWYTNGVLDGAATSSRLILPNAQAGSFITNYCILTNVAGSATSMVWTASVVAAPTAPYPTSVLALGPLGYWRLNEPDDNQFDGNPGTLALDYASGNNGIYTNIFLGQSGYNSSTDPSDTSPIFGEFGNLPAVNNLAAQIQGITFAVTNGGSGEFTVEAWVNGVNSGSFPQIVGGPIATKGLFNHDDQFNLGIDTTKLHYRFYVRNAAGTVFTCGSGSEPPLDNAWHHLVGVCDEANGLLSIYFDGKLASTASIATNSGVFADTEPMTIGAGTQDGITYANQFIGSINDVAVFNYALSSSQVAAEYSSSGVGPSFTQVPSTNITVNGGGVLVIPATFIGSTPLNWQWSDVHGGSNIVSGTANSVPFNATLTVSNVPAGWNNDQLELTVNNTFGSTNIFVSLTVFTNAPVITQDIPAQVAFLPGTPYNYSVSVAGPTPYSYQWYQNGTVILNQTNSTYATTAGSAGSSSAYFVVVTNIYGAVTSSVSTFTGLAQLTTPYATNLLQYHPVGYWPLQETNLPAPVTMETNYGTLGKLGNAYYAITNAANAVFNKSGAIAGDTDTAVAFNGGSGNANSYAFVPRISPSLTIQAPYTLEVWANPSNNAYGVTLGEGGGIGLNGSANFAGWQMGMGVSGGNNSFQMNYYTGIGNAQNDEIETNLFYTPLQWYHFVITYDGANSIMYVNGQSIYTNTSPMAADTWSPLAIGAGKWDFGPIGGIRWFTGVEDEVAVYTNVLTPTQVNNHYVAGTTGGNYMQTILGDNPLLYYRMDCPGYTNASQNISPLALNFGSAPVDGFYHSGAVPGELSGPSGFGTNAVAAGLNGVFSCVNAGSNPAFNATGAQPFTALTWFKTYPSDGRIQDLMSHGTNWALVLDGTNGDVVWDTQGAGPVLSLNNFNDNNWHMAAGVYDGTNSMLYVDGQLNGSLLATTPQSGDSSNPLFLGGNAAFAAVGNNQQYFAGALAQAAFFTNALTAAQIAQLYAVVVPVNTSPTKIAVSLNGGMLTLSWPLDHTGWTLQSQTNSLSTGIGPNWVNVSGSTTTNQITVPVNLTKGCVFYQLVYHP